MAKSKAPEGSKRDRARQRYIESEIGQRALASEVGVDPKTIARWSVEENWPDLRQQHARRMSALKQDAIAKAVTDDTVRETAKALADDLEKYRKALDWTLGLAVQGLRDPSLKFKDLGQGIGSLAKLIQVAGSLYGEGDDNAGIPAEILELFRGGGAAQPGPADGVFTPPGADHDPREP